MYSVVMMMALSGSPAVADFGGRRSCCGCYGAYYSCSGYYGCYGCYGCGGRRSRRHGCCGCYGGYYYYPSCYGPAYPTPEKAPAPKKVAAPATLVVSLPAAARLTIDGQATSGNSEMRQFVTPPLEPGTPYQYVLKAVLVREGQSLTATQQVTVRAGQVTQASFREDEFAVTAAGNIP